MFVGDYNIYKVNEEDAQRHSLPFPSFAVIHKNYGSAIVFAETIEKKLEDAISYATNETERERRR